jgi:uncharacterized membrane protein YqjE
MDGEVSETGPTDEPGFFKSLKSIVATLAALLHTRLELASTELEEELERLKRVLLLAAISLFCAGVGIVLVTVFVVAVFWDTHRFVVLGACAALYLIAGVMLALAARRSVTGRPRLFAATISELGKDREHLES